MDLESLCQQATYVSNSDQLVVKWQLEHFFNEVWQRHAPGSFPLALKSYIFFDAIHALLRNALWWPNAFFVGALTHLVQERYQMPLPLASTLVEELVQEFAKSYPLSDEAKEYFAKEKCFVDYLLVKALTGKSWQAVMTELGLGRYFLDKIDACAKGLSRKEDSTLLFVSDFEKLMSQELSALSLQKSKLPWVFDVHRLGFVLATDFIALHLKPDLIGFQIVFQCLLCMGQQQGLGVKQAELILSDLKSLSRIPEDFQPGRVAGEILRALRDQDIIDWKRGSTKRAPELFVLTQAGFELTQNAYASQKQQAQLAFADFCQLPHPWQAALVSTPVQSRAAIVAGILSTKPLLHPSVIEALAPQITLANEKADLESIVRTGVMKAPTLEARRQFCALATKMLPREQALELLKPVVSSSAAAKLRQSVAVSLLSAYQM